MEVEYRTILGTKQKIDTIIRAAKFDGKHIVIMHLTPEEFKDFCWEYPDILASPTFTNTRRDGQNSFVYNGIFCKEVS